jgi:N-acetylmuramoyl-L-alanine amidase
MRIVRHKLVRDEGPAIPFLESPNVGGDLKPQYLVMHYTAASSAAGSIQWFLNPAAKACAHLIIARDGAITQMVPFNRVAWHAGESSWMGLREMNQWSIGIELENAGKLQNVGGEWKTWYGETIPETQVIQAVHKAETILAGWETYTQPQIETAAEVAALLVSNYELRDVIGHEDIAPGRKTDPGPAFPMLSFRAKVMGRASAKLPSLFTTTVVNIRSGPGTEFPTIPGSPLPEKTEVGPLESSGVWVRANVTGTVNDVNDVVGWVHSQFLTDRQPRP